MKLTVLHRLFSTVLSVLVLISTLSLTIEKHFCGDVLIDVAIFSEVEKCAGDRLENPSDVSSVKKSCCKDEITLFEGINEVTTAQFEDLTTLHKQLLFAYTYAYITVFQHKDLKTATHRYYQPPKLIRDIQVLLDTYLI